MTMHLVFLECKLIRLFLHQPDTSLRLFCNVISISFTVSPFVSRDESSANREFLTFLSRMCKGRSFINMQNSRGPRILPCGTPDCMVPTADNLPFAQTYCDLSDRYYWKKGTTEELFKYTLKFCCRIVWSTRSKAFLKSKTQLLQFRSDQQQTATYHTLQTEQCDMNALI